MSQEIIYQTGYTTDGVPLIGGVWALRQQEGFPLEMSYMVCQSHGWLIDWLEAMGDASRTNDLPALMQQVEAFLPSGDLLRMKLGFCAWLEKGKPFAELVEEKRRNGAKLSAFVPNDQNQQRRAPGTKP